MTEEKEASEVTTFSEVMQLSPELSAMIWEATLADDSTQRVIGILHEKDGVLEKHAIKI